MKKEKTVKTHTRKTKSGKTVTVKQHTAKYNATDMAKDIVKKAGAGAELEKVKKVRMQNDPYKEYGFTAEEFAEWYEGTGSKADKKVEKALRTALGKKAYDDLNDAAADGYKKGGAAGFFKREVKIPKVKDSAEHGGTSKESKAKEPKPSRESPKEPKMASLISVSGKNYVAVRPSSEHNIGEYLYVREGKVYRESEKGFRRVYKKHLGEEAYNYVLGVATKTSETEGNKAIKKSIVERTPKSKKESPTPKLKETKSTKEEAHLRGVSRRLGAEDKLREWKIKNGIDERYLPETDTNPKRRQQYLMKVVGLTKEQAVARSKKIDERQSSKVVTKPRKKKKNTPEQDAALDAALAEIRERNRQPYQVSRKP